MQRKLNQTQFIISQLKRRKKISRNMCLANYITRLSARVNDLKEAGWNIEGRFVKGKYGKDYVYFVTE